MQLQGYSNADNPFGDEHLMDTFVWSKKIAKEGKDDLDQAEIQQMTKKKMEENRVRTPLLLSLYSQDGSNEYVTT